MKKAYGFIEMKGLASAVVAVDTALKAANVEIEGLEPAKGQGMHTLKINGEVGAVHAAVSSILGSSELQGKVYSHTVIARPSDGLELMIHGMDDLKRKENTNKETAEQSPQPEREEPSRETSEGASGKEDSEEEDTSEAESSIEQKAEQEEQSEEEESAPIMPGPGAADSVQAPMEEGETKAPEQDGMKKKRKNVVTCNLCGDPECLRVKGEPRVKCIHYKEKE
ncbi:BMC domain-containing protein [Proteiniclasticum sp. C24MP]|uniref:BMC domain-containing protein n=1 Tax=Proteiniclasticum sp. C24MP TaxID=3374101 RepID=UPI0037552A1B